MPPKRWHLINLDMLRSSFDLKSTETCQCPHLWINRNSAPKQSGYRPTAPTTGLNDHFSETEKQESLFTANNSEVMQEEASYLLLETSTAYGGEIGAQNLPLSVDNTVFGTPIAIRQRLGKAQR